MRNELTLINADCTMLNNSRIYLCFKHEVSTNRQRLHVCGTNLALTVSNPGCMPMLPYSSSAGSGISSKQQQQRPSFDSVLACRDSKTPAFTKNLQIKLFSCVVR